jgi:hypothetical protein
MRGCRDGWGTTLRSSGLRSGPLVLAKLGLAVGHRGLGPHLNLGRMLPGDERHVGMLRLGLVCVLLIFWTCSAYLRFSIMVGDRGPFATGQGGLRFRDSLLQIMLGLNVSSKHNTIRCLLFSFLSVGS